MKYISTLIVLCCFAFAVNAQQESLYTNYIANGFVVNPAMAGSSDNHEIRAYNRWQWTAFPGAPSTIGLSYSGGINNNGFGASLFRDKTGPTLRYGGQVAYAYHLKLNDAYNLSIGLGGRFQRQTIDVNNIEFQEDTDIAVMEAAEGANAADANAGLFFYSKKLYVGFAVPNLLQSRTFGEAGDRDPSRLYRHYYVMGGYKFTHKKIMYEPSIIMRKTQAAPFQIEGGIMVHFQNGDIAAGLAYRSPSFLSFMLKFVFDNKFPVLISLDISTSKFQEYGGLTSEIIMGMDMMRKDRNMNFITAPPMPVINE